MSPKLLDLAIFSLLASVVFLVNGASLDAEILMLDDQRYLAYVSGLSPWSIHDLWRMLTEFNSSNWHPLTWYSLALDQWLFGGTSRGYHLSNLVLHAINAGLLFLLTRILVLKGMGEDRQAAHGTTRTGKLAFLSALIAALLFAVHPLHVESVAWIAERKDLLCGAAFIASLLFYCRYLERVGNPGQGLYYGLSLGFAVLALMAKPMAVTLPVALLLLDFFPYQRFSFSYRAGLAWVWRAADTRVLLEKIPFFLAVLGVIVLTLLAQQQGGSIQGWEVYPPVQRILNSVYSLFFYLGKFVFPLQIHPYYPFPEFIASVSLKAWLPVLGFVGVTALSFLQWRKGKSLLLALWLYYVVTLLPVIGLVQVGWQAAADRYIYLPTLPLFMVIGLGAARVLLGGGGRSTWAPRAGVMLLVVATIGLLSAKSISQTRIWKNDATLWQYTVAVNPGHWAVQSNLAFQLLRQGQLTEARDRYIQSIALYPHEDSRYALLGDIQMNLGAFAQARELYEVLAARAPGNPIPFQRLGDIGLAMGQPEAAMLAYQQSLANHAGNRNARLGLVFVHLLQQDLALARTTLLGLLEDHPDFERARALLKQMDGD